MATSAMAEKELLKKKTKQQLSSTLISALIQTYTQTLRVILL
jgi:hypothetical protein